MVNLTTWTNQYNGVYIDVDNFEGNQCWDLAQFWLTACNGGTLWTQPSRWPGLAAGSWDVANQNTWSSQDLLRHVTAHPASELGQPGDILIFAYGSANYPISHTAILIKDYGWGIDLDTFSQNSTPARPDLPGYSDKSTGPSVFQKLSRDGLLGFLRPIATISVQGSNPVPIPEGQFMNLPLEEQEEMRDNLRKLVHMATFIKESVKPINTADGPVPLRQFVADGTRASQKAAQQTADIHFHDGDVSLRQVAATTMRKVQGVEDVVIDIAEIVKAEPVDEGIK